MTGDVTVAAGVTLTIEPGVTVQGNAQTRLLTVNGSLIAEGTGGSHIVFTSTSDSAPGQWNGITFGTSAGASSLKYVDIRYGGANGASHLNSMLTFSGGTLTLEDATVSGSSVTGLKVNGGTSGTAASATVRRTKFEGNGFQGAALQGDGLFVNNARVVVEDSAFWSNARDGIYAEMSSGYTPSPPEVSGSSIWDNRRFGVYIFQGLGAEALGPDGHVAGKPGNAIYDNGTFGFTVGESWQQLQVTRVSLAVDWTDTYWGPVSFVPCGVGNMNGHLSYGVPDPDPNANFPIARGPVSRTFASSGPNWCGNDDLLVNPPAYAQPDLYFDPPPPTFGGLLGVDGCLRCAYANAGIAMANDAMGGSQPSYTDNPVNTATGALAEMASDLRLAGPGIPFEWTRAYNSNDTSPGGLGPGWTHPFEASLTVVNPGTGELEYVGGSGQRTRFTKVTGTTGAAKYRGKGFDGTLDRLADLTYKLVTRDQRTFTFNTAGQLTSIKPRFRPATTLAYTSGKLSSITDSAGRAITLSYANPDPSLITRVTLPDTRYVEYGYTGGRVTSVRDPRGKTWTLAYDANGRLQSIRDPLNRYELQNVLYDGQGRVTSEQNGTGDTIAYAYTSSGGYDVTTVTIPGRGDWVYRHRSNLLFSLTDPLGHSTSYTYDAMGRRATIKDGRGNVRRFEYDAYGNVVKEIAPPALGYPPIERTFNATNDLLTEKDGRGNTTAYAYASAAGADYQVGQLQTITDRENGVTTFKYWTTTSTPVPPATNVGLLKSAQNPRLKTTLYDYDASGNLTKLTSPLGLKTTMTYDASGRLLSRRDPRGNVPPTPAGYLTKWTYDEADHVATLTDPGPTDAGGAVTTYAYADNELLASVTRTDRDGSPRVTSFEYDSDNRLWKTTEPNAASPETRLYWPDGQLKSVQSPEGRTTSYDYDAAGQLTSLVEPNGNAAGGTPTDWTWTYGYDNAGNRTSEAHPDGGTRQIAYDALDRPFQWTDALNHLTSVDYDANGNVTKQTNGLTKFETYTYDKLDRVKTFKDERQLAQPWIYDYYATGELKCLTTPKGFVTNYGLDNDGRRTSMIDPRAAIACGGTSATYTWTYAYDEAGNRKTVTDPLGNHADTVYNALNQPTSVTDERGNPTTYIYDVMNRLWKVTPPAAGGTGTLYTEYAYDPRGNLASRVDPNAHTTTWTYDLDGLLTQKTRPLIGSWNYTYFANGTLKTLEKPSGSSTPTFGDGTITYDYDHMSRLTSVGYSDTTPDVARTYDLAGRLDTMTDGAGGTVDYSFDDADRLTDIARTGAVAGLNGTFHYGYDDAGNVTARTYPDTTATSSVFDEDGRLTSVASGGATTAFGYDRADNVTTVTLPAGNGYVATRTFDTAGRLTTVENKKGTNTLSKFVWTLDAAANPTKERTIRTGMADNYNVYTYDTRNRITASCFGVTSGTTNCNSAANKITYAYDKVSNRTQEVRAGNVGGTGTFNYTYNAADQLTARSATTYTYDANGNQASAGARTFAYDLADRLASTTNGGVTTTYGYDGDDRRVASTVSGGGADLRLVWDPLPPSGIPELALERTPAGALVRRYFDGPLGAVSMTNASATFYYHADPLNTVTDMTNASGAAQWRYTYEGYGAPRTTTNVSGSAPESRLRFNSAYLDAETGHYHLRARQYDPTVGRFGALDPLEAGLRAPFDSAYTYVSGRPSVLVDPLGLRAIEDEREWSRWHHAGAALFKTVDAAATAGAGGAIIFGCSCATGLSGGALAALWFYCGTAAGTAFVASGIEFNSALESWKKALVPGPSTLEAPGAFEPPSPSNQF
jgi:RHS repeat-associated protein